MARAAYRGTRPGWFRLLVTLTVIGTSALLLASCGGSSATKASRLRQVAVLGHGRLEDIDWSPNGEILAIAGSIGVYLFDPNHLDAPPRPLLQGMNVGGWAQNVAFSPDGTIVAIGNKSGEIHLRDVRSGTDLQVFTGHKGWIGYLAFSPDGTLLASTSGFVNDRTVRLWDVAAAKERAVIDNELWPPQGVTFCPNSTALVFGTADGNIHQWDITTGQRRLIASQRGGVYSLACSPDGKFLAAGSSSGTIRLWDMTSGGEPIALTGHTGMVQDLAFRADATLLASAGQDGSVRIWQLAAPSQSPQVVRSRAKVVKSIDWSPDGSLLAVGNDDGSVQLWHVASNQERSFLPSDIAYQVQYSPDGTVLASGSEDAIYFWDVHTHARTGAFSETGRVTTLAFHPNGTLLASNGPEHTIRLWDVQNRKVQTELRGHTDSVEHLAFSPDGSTLASCSKDRTVRLWNVRSGQQQAVLEGHQLPVKEVAFNVDGSLIAAVSSDSAKEGAVLVWQVHDHQVRYVLPGMHVVTFNPSGKLLVSGGPDGTVRLWRMDRDAEELSVFGGHRGILTALAFNRKGNILATGSSADFGIILWSTDPGGDVRVENKITTLYAHTSSVWSLAFGANDQLASASFDGSIRLWEPVAK